MGQLANAICFELLLDSDCSDCRSSHLYASQRLLTNSLAETMTGEDEHSCQPGTAARLEEANQPGQTPVYDVFLGGSCGTTVINPTPPQFD